MYLLQINIKSDYQIKQTNMSTEYQKLQSETLPLKWIHSFEKDRST